MGRNQNSPTNGYPLERPLVRKPHNSPWVYPNTNPSPRVAPHQPPHKRLTSSEIEERRLKGLCFWCDEKYTFGHKCTNKRLFTLVLEPKEETVEDSSEGESAEEIQKELVVSMHALHGIGMHSINQTMKLIGCYKKKRLSLLVDLGSSHNFLDATVAKGVGCPTQLISAHKVLVANIDRLTCSSICKEFEW